MDKILSRVVCAFAKESIELNCGLWGYGDWMRACIARVFVGNRRMRLSQGKIGMLKGMMRVCIALYWCENWLVGARFGRVSTGGLSHCDGALR